VEAWTCVVIVAYHSSLDYQAVVNDRALVMDSRNALKAFRSEKIVRL
jgi:UDP-N-acetyl-D-mannosaminuronate dehydrogenase